MEALPPSQAGALFAKVGCPRLQAGFNSVSDRAPGVVRPDKGQERQAGPQACGGQPLNVWSDGLRLQKALGNPVGGLPGRRVGLGHLLTTRSSDV